MPANLTPQYWMFWIGLILVLIVVVGRERMTGWWLNFAAAARELGRRLIGGRGLMSSSTQDPR